MLWQLQSRISPSKFFVKEFVKPIKFYARKGLAGVTGNIYSGLHEFDDMAFLLHFLRKEDRFFDVGSNVGSFTLLASGICGAKSTTVEPVTYTYDILNNNVALNNLGDKVTTINAAAGGTIGMITFTSDEDTTNHVVADDEEKTPGTITVPVITVDSLSVNGVPALIKIDVEGYETEVLKGMNDTLDSPTLKAIIIELNGSGVRYGYDEEKIHQLFLSKKFKPYTYDPFSRALKAMESYGKHNTIYCRDEDFISQRLKEATGISIMGETI